MTLSFPISSLVASATSVCSAYPGCSYILYGTSFSIQTWTWSLALRVALLSICRFRRKNYCCISTTCELQTVGKHTVSTNKVSLVLISATNSFNFVVPWVHRPMQSGQRSYQWPKIQTNTNFFEKRNKQHRVRFQNVWQGLPVLSNLVPLPWAYCRWIL